MAQTPASFEMDYWPPAPALAGLVSGYHRYSVSPPAGALHQDVFYPSWTNLRWYVAGDTWRIRIGECEFEPGRASLFGPTSHALFSQSSAGTVIGVGITPLGWTRLRVGSALTYADRVTPLEPLLPGAQGLTGPLAEAQADAIPEILDAWLLPRLGKPHRDDARIGAIHRALVERRPGSVVALAHQLNLSPRTFHRLAEQSFGFSPKLLLRRTRFLRSLMALREAPDRPCAEVIDDDYHDDSHFIRDSHSFLGMPPREFLALSKPMSDASLKLRSRVLGSPVQALLTPPLRVDPRPTLRN